jgi:VWFA-related protein
MLAVVAPLAAIPQDDAPPVVLDVTVTAAGRTVPDLKAEAFRVLHDRESHKILDVSYVNAGRQIILLVDDLNLSAENIGKVRGALRGFIDERMLPGDRVSIVRSSADAAFVLAPTTDKRTLHAAAAAIQTVPSIEASAAAKERRFRVGTLGTLEVVLTCFSNLPGRKILVLFSDAPGLSLPSPGRTFDASILDRANLSFTVFYLADLRNPATAFSRSANQPESGLERLARETGGAVFDNAPSITLDRILAEQEGYYLLRLDSDFPPVVKVLRLGALVRSRRIPGEHLGLLTPGLLHSLSMASSPGSLHTKLTVGFADSNDGTSLMGLLYVEGRDLGFTRTGEGLYRYAFEVGATVSGEDGFAMDRGTRLIDGQMNEEQYRRAVREGLVVPLRIPAAPPAWHIRVGLKDDTSGRLGLSYQYADVPNHRSGDLGLSGVLLSGEERRLSASGKTLRALPDGPALRIFQSGDALAYTAEIYHLLADGESRGRAECRIRVLQDGREVFSRPPVLVPLDMAGMESRTITGRLMLPPDLQPGRYWLELTVIDKLVQDKPRAASVYTDFEVAQSDMKGQK